MKAYVNYASYSETELWEALRRGKKGALEHLHQTYYDSLFSYGLKMVRDEVLVENCLQDLFVSLWRLRENLGAVQSIKAYLIMSFRRDLLKKRDALQKERRQVTQFLQEEPCLIFSPEDLVIAEESSAQRLHFLASLLNNLTDRQKEIIYLRYYENLSLQEIGDLLAINAQSVANHLQRSFESLRKNRALFTRAIEMLMLLLCPMASQLVR